MSAFIRLAGALALTLLSDPPVPKLDERAPDFSLFDQYERPFRLSENRGKVLLLLYGDRKGSAFMGNWAKAVRGRYAQESSPPVTIIQMANLDGVPGFLRGMVKNRFRGKTTSGQPRPSVLLDWDGAVARMYGFKKDETNAYLIDMAGVLRFRGNGRGEGAELGPLLQLIGDLLSEAKREPRKTSG